jgi:hypothetical protein
MVSYLLRNKYCTSDTIAIIRVRSIHGLQHQKNISGTLPCLELVRLCLADNIYDRVKYRFAL